MRLKGLLILAMAVLTACAPAMTPPPTVTPIPPTTTAPTSLPPTAESTATQALRPTPSGESLFPKVTADDWQLGPADARVTIIEYGDYQ